MIREATSEDWMRTGLAVLLAAGCLAGCSSLSCELPQDPGMTAEAAWRPVPLRADNRSGPSRPAADDVETVGSIPGGAQGVSADRSGPVIRDSKLFSSKEDSRPWPLAGSPEARKQDEDDKRREHEISTVVNICHC
jgi:hypothetical protein